MHSLFRLLLPNNFQLLLSMLHLKPIVFNLQLFKLNIHLSHMQTSILHERVNLHPMHPNPN